MRSDTRQLMFRHHMLRRILLWLEKETGLEFIETSTVRIGDDGVHGTMPLRATDLRCRNKPIGKIIVAFINANWKYDHMRPDMVVAVLHGKGSNLHIHLQVHNNTR